MENGGDEPSDHLAASVVLAGLSAAGANKRGNDDSLDATEGSNSKKIRQAPNVYIPAAFAADGTALNLIPAEAEPVAKKTAPPPPVIESRELKPYPFFYYMDHSQEADPDSLTPLTPPGRVPNFPAKMHAIMSRPDLADVICWMEHGRSWKVLKPREFEVRVIPTYFEHSKFSSFIRQANGWGFRRITAGRDRNSYYHPLFLRSMPHLCKQMKRPGVSKKLAADPEHEPDLYKISELHPVPEKKVDDSILLQCILQGGPKARMPIYSGILGPSIQHTVPTMSTPPSSEGKKAAIATPPAKLTPTDQETLASFQASIGEFSAKTSPVASPASSADEAQTPATAVPTPAIMPPQLPFMMPPAFMMPQTFASPAVSGGASFPAPGLPHGNQTLSALAAANQMAFGCTPANPFAAFQANAAASQFAAGFAAAAAFNQQQLQSMLQNMQQQSGVAAASVSGTSVTGAATASTPTK